MTMTDAYTIRQTECLTGWQILYPDGRVYLTVRRYESAQEICEELNVRVSAMSDADGGSAEPFGRCS